MTNDRVRAIYDRIAQRYSNDVVDNAYNAHYERPALLGMLPDIEGWHILDAGCGSGIYAQELMARRAEIVGIDASPGMIDQARERLGADAELHVADLNKPLDFLPDTSFDAVISALTVHYLLDWHALFGEFRRVLKPEGLFLFSCGHPMPEYELSETGRYFDIESLEFPWPDWGIIMPGTRRPLQAMIDPLTDNGFVIDRIVEPRPAQELCARHPDVYEKLNKRPQFICIAAFKRPGRENQS